MQGKKLLPGLQNIARRRRRPGAPDRGRGNRALDAAEKVAKTRALKLGLKLGAFGIGFHMHLVAGIMPETMRENVDQRALELLGIGVVKLRFRKFLHPIVQQP